MNEPQNKKQVAMRAINFSYDRPAANGEPPTVVRVTEGLSNYSKFSKPSASSPSPTAGSNRAQRIFSVVLSAPCDDDDLAVVATAQDPIKGTAIPEPGSTHPRDDNLVARPPKIYPVGLRMKDGAMVADSSCFYNLRVPYVAHQTTEDE